MSVGQSSANLQINGWQGDHAVAYLAGNVFRVALRRITKPCPAGKFHHKAVVRRNGLLALGVELLSGR